MIELLELVFSSDITQPERSVALVIASAINETRPQLGCWLGLRTIADRSGYSRRTVIRCLHNLQLARVLTIEKRSGSSSIYRMNKTVVVTCARQEAVTRARFVHSLAPSEPVTHGHPCHTVTGIATEQPVPHSHPPVSPGHRPVTGAHPAGATWSPPPVPRSHPESEVELEVELEAIKRETEVVSPLFKKGERPNGKVQNTLVDAATREPEETEAQKTARIEENRQRQLQAVRERMAKG